MQKISVPAPTRRTRAKREIRRASILEGARKCFQDIGYNNATIEDVLKYAHISRGTFYSHFESKSSILIAIVETVEPRLLDLFGEIGSLATVTRNELEIWLNDLLDFFATEPDILQIWGLAMKDLDFLVFLQGLGERLAHQLGIPPLQDDNSAPVGQMFSAFFLAHIGQLCSFVVLSPISSSREEATRLIADILYRSYATMAREDPLLRRGNR